MKNGLNGIKFLGGHKKSFGIKSKRYLIEIFTFVPSYVPFHVLLLNSKVNTL